MYAVTFYSFKGGVGRTMAMVNTAFALAQSGRKVVLVDFDLEAPGLTTFDRLRPDRPRPGVVEFVGRYLDTGVVPELDEFVFEANNTEAIPGKVWVLPAGKEDLSYRRTLAQINWIDLYRRNDGFLLFEDLKCQIETKYRPDYVLIDSRTGHSDIEGICTRQLPDAVVVLFFPNEQNLSGLETVCRNIRSERNAGLKKDINLHFVMSNVPDLDDEDSILRGRIRDFRKRLGFDKLTTTIHHYNSLTLLNQSIFVLDRPASRLAKQYRRLFEEIRKGNLSEQQVAIDFLKQVQSPEHGTMIEKRGASWLQDTEEKIRQIDEKFPDDAKVELAVAEATLSLGHVREAVNRLDKLLHNDPDLVEARIARASSLATLGDKRRGVEDLVRCIESSTITEWQTISVIRLLSSLEIAKVSSVAESPAIIRLSPMGKYLIAESAMRHPWAWNFADVKQSMINLLRDALAQSKLDRIGAVVIPNALSLLLIHEGRWDEVMHVIGPLSDSSTGAAHTFNLAMAVWGQSGTAFSVQMGMAYKAIIEEAQSLDANFQQCAAIAAWAVGDVDQAIKYLDSAAALAKIRPGPIFSCWRYANVTNGKFVEDCMSMRSMFHGGKEIPLFVEQHRASTMKQSRNEN
jgi:cellulose biosynthesis protein BcsQ